MPRANRHLHVLAGRTYHVTHRCHDRAFLLKFARDRDAYRAWLLRGLKGFDVAVLSYCITSNHIHLLLRAPRPDEISGFMQYVAGNFAQTYNLRKKRHGAFWSDRYHATLVDGREHLWACLRYIDLNMVRAGAVRHPREWSWTAWGELTGERKRNRVIDLRILLMLLEEVDPARFRANYTADLGEQVARGTSVRDTSWTDSVAVGTPSFVERVREELLQDYARKRLTTEPGPEAGRMILREAPHVYGTENRPENSPIGHSGGSKTR